MDCRPPGHRPLLPWRPDQMQAKRAPLGAGPVLPEVDSLPGAEHQLASLEAQAQARAGEGSADVGRHVNWPLVSVNVGAQGALAAITAAVVGVILNLALFFGYHVLWPSGLGGTLDGASAAIALLAAVALFKYKLNVIYVIAACGLAGVVVRFLM